MKTSIPIKIALLLSAALGVPDHAMGTSVQLQVRGSIRPGTCIPNLEAAGLINYADVSYDSLNQNEPNHFDTREIALSIICAAPTRVGIRTIDNRSASKLILPNVGDKNAMYGLGMTGKTSIGAFHLAIRKLDGDNAALELLARDSQAGAIWRKNDTGAVRTDQINSWGPPGTGTVGVYQRITATLGVTPVLNRASALPANEAINFDGATTIEIVYL